MIVEIILLESVFMESGVFFRLIGEKRRVIQVGTFSFATLDTQRENEFLKYFFV